MGNNILEEEKSLGTKKCNNSIGGNKQQTQVYALSFWQLKLLELLELGLMDWAILHCASLYSGNALILGPYPTHNSLPGG
jgi:hypothetical protein